MYRLIVICLILMSWHISAAAEIGLTDAEIKAILVARINTTQRGVGIVVGVVDEKGERVVNYGWFDQEKKRPVDGETVFEIGSITKVFTAVLLQEMVDRSLMQIDTPVAKYLPATMSIPMRDGKEISLLHLATHTSALPRMPSNFQPKDPMNPYADYTVERMTNFLASYSLPREIGSQVEYSNLGYGLLGHAIALKTGEQYETLVLERIAKPLQMKSTSITLNAELQSRLAPGHNAKGEQVANWDIPTFAGAGALRSTVHDLLKFTVANLGLTETPLNPTLQRTHEIRVRGKNGGTSMALGWHVNHAYDREIIWHNGGTGGYHSFLGFDPKRKLGVVVLANSTLSIDDIGFHLLEHRYPLAKLPAR